MRSPLVFQESGILTFNRLGRLQVVGQRNIEVDCRHPKGSSQQSSKYTATIEISFKSVRVSKRISIDTLGGLIVAHLVPYSEKKATPPRAADRIAT